MLPFSVSLLPGAPVVEQVVYAVTRAIVSGQLRPGDRFPSVRTLSQELRVNPNTAQRVVAELVDRDLLEVQPGIGTLVAALTDGSRRQRAALGDEFADRLIVEARRLGLSLQDTLELVREQWRRMDGSR